MSRPKIGDRVRVEFEGDVASDTFFKTNYVAVRFDDATFYMKPENCTVIVPPVKVGDVLTDDTVFSLPHDSIAAKPNGPAYRCYHCEDGISWTDEVQDLRRDVLVGATVLRIGGGS